jgi:hypothetical protein
MGWATRAKEAAMEMLPTTLDARGRPLQEGDEVLLRLAHAPYFRVVRIEASVDPRDPPGILVVTLATPPFKAARGQINAEFVRVRTAAEIAGQGLSATAIAGPAPRAEEG